MVTFGYFVVNFCFPTLNDLLYALVTVVFPIGLGVGVAFFSVVVSEVVSDVAVVSAVVSSAVVSSVVSSEDSVVSDSGTVVSDSLLIAVVSCGAEVTEDAGTALPVLHAASESMVHEAINIASIFLFIYIASLTTILYPHCFEDFRQKARKNK